MSRIRDLIHEAHRRSLWQVVAIYLAGSWVALQVVESLTESAGLPDWVPSFALVLLVLGLPMCLATAFVQEGVGAGSDPVESKPGEEAPESAGAAAPDPAAGGPPPSDDSGLHHTLFTWKNAVIGGVLAFTLLGVAVGAYFFMWSTGVGPVGSLVAQGVLDERDQVVLADFGNATSDSLLGGVVTEALRVDLLESRTLTVVDPSFTQQVLRRMRRDPSTRMTAEVAREVAQRGGLKAVIQGEVGAAGEGYVLTARLIEAESGRTLAAFRETAEDDGELIRAIDKLSQRIREKAGESLRSIKAGEPLETVTTTSLGALRKYSQGMTLGDRGELERGIEVLEEAVALDSTFAMAWRKLGVLLGNARRGGSEVDSAVARAYRLRDRLTDRERYAAVAHYHFTVTDSLDRTERAYRNLLDIDPDNSIALNNLALLLMDQDENEEALELLERAVAGPGESSVAHQNRVVVLARLDRLDDAEKAVDRYIERYPDDFRSLRQGVWLAVFRGEWQQARILAEEGLERFDTGLARRDFTLVLGHTAIARGNLDDAERHYEAVMAEVGPDEAQDAVEDLSEATAILGYPDGALERVRRAYAPSGLLGELPEEEWDWPFILGIHARAGEEVGLEEMWERLLEDVPPGVTEEDIQRLSARVEAELALGRGRWDEAVDRFEEMRRSRDCGVCFLPELGLARMEAGRTAEAIAALEEWLGERSFDLSRAAYEPVLLERLGRLYEDAGDTAKAMDAYRRFAERWESADPRFQPRVEAARARVSALGGSASDTE